MRIVLIALDYAPDVAGIAAYTTALSEALSALGHDVSAVTSFPHYPKYRWSEPEKVRFPWATESRNGVRVRRVWALLPRRNRAFWRLAMDGSFALLAFIAAFRMSARADVVISVCVPAPAGVVGGILGRVRRARSIFWIQDLALEAAISTGILPRHGLIYRLGRALERFACRLNDRVVVINKAFASYVASLGVAEDVISVIPNWVLDDGSRAVDEEEREGIRRELGARDGEFLLLHAGNIGEKQGLEPFIGRLAESGQQPKLVILGGGSAEAKVRAAAASADLDVRFLEFQERDRLRAILAAADALLLSQLPTVTTSVVPSKLVSYMGAGRPILAAVNAESAAAQLVREAGCGIVVDPADRAAVGAGLRELAEMPEGERARIGQAGTRYIEKNLQRPTVLAAWESVLAGL